MNSISGYPTVLIVGRTNVGKSTLFNRLAQEKKSLVFSRSGVTRDAISTPMNWAGKKFTLIDTGGMTFGKHEDVLQKKVQEKVMALLQTGELILFVCDGTTGLTYEDQEIARILHRTGKKIIVLINKADNTSIIQQTIFEFNRLGIPDLLPVSGIHGIGIADLLEKIVAELPIITEEQEEATEGYRITIIGKPNVGKSSLMNILVGHERSIVSPIAGTTREALAETITQEDCLITLIDTAGVRRKRSVDDPLEELMVKSSMEAIRTSDTVILMIDASEGTVSDQELKLLFYAYEEKKNLLVIFNKSDLQTEWSRERLADCLKDYHFIFKKIPVLTISCVTKKNCFKIFDELNKIRARAQQVINSTDLNTLVQEALKHKPLYHCKQPLKLFKIRVVPGSSPTFVLHVNHPEWFDAAALGCIENIIRDSFDLKGCPLIFRVQRV